MTYAADKTAFLDIIDRFWELTADEMVDSGNTADQKLFAAYYDPGRSAYNLKAAGLISATICDDIIAGFLHAYRDTYLVSNSYAPAAPFFYSTGLKMHAESGSGGTYTTSKNAIASMVANCGLINHTGTTDRYADPHYARECAFALTCLVNNYLIGNAALDARAATFKSRAITMLSNWRNGTFTYTQPYIRPFMVSLISDALFYANDNVASLELSNAEWDTLEDLWQHIYSTCWRSADTYPSHKFTSVRIVDMDPDDPNTDEQQVLYDQNQDAENQDGTGRDVELMLLHVFARLYKEGYGVEWQERFDESFENNYPHYVGLGGGSHQYGAYIGYDHATTPNVNGKHVNQQLFAFAEAVEWREEGPGAAEEPGAGTGGATLGGMMLCGCGGAPAAATATVSGTITLAGAALSGVTVNMTGGSTASTTTNGSGNYSFTGLAVGINVTITPTLTGYTFSPTSTAGVLTAGINDRDFTATASSSYNPGDYYTGETVKWHHDLSDTTKVLDSGGASASADEAVQTINAAHGTSVLTQATAANQGIVKTGISNGKQALQLDGSNDLYTMSTGANDLRLATKISYTVCFKLLGTAANAQFYTCHDGTWTDYRFRLFLSGASAALAFQGGKDAAAAQLISTTNLATGSIHVIQVEWDVSTARLWLRANNADTNIASANSGGGTAFGSTGFIQDSAAQNVRWCPSANVQIFADHLVTGALSGLSGFQSMCAALKTKFGITTY